MQVRLHITTTATIYYLVMKTATIVVEFAGKIRYSSTSDPGAVVATRTAIECWRPQDQENWAPGDAAFRHLCSVHTAGA